MSYFPRLKNDVGEVNILLVSTIIFGVAAFIFSITSIYSVLDSQNVHRNLNSEKTAAYKSGQDAQKKQDKLDEQAANQTPYRSYKAGDAYGSFEIKFPKNWNASITENLSATNQVSMIMNPEFIKINGDINQAGNNYAFRLMLVRQTFDSLRTNFDQRVKSKKMTTKTVRVSGITAQWYEGAYDNNHNGIYVLVPVRDKTIEFVTDFTKDYLNEFNQILAQADIPT